MTNHNERAQDVVMAEEPAVKSEEGARAQGPRRPRTRVLSEALVAAIPAQAEAEPGGGADDGAGAGA